MTNMRRWSDAKLEKESVFAVAAFDSKCPHNVAWLNAIQAEMDRRASLGNGAFVGLTLSVTA